MGAFFLEGSFGDVFKEKNYSISDFQTKQRHGSEASQHQFWWILQLNWPIKQPLASGNEAVEAPGSFHAPVSAEEKSGPGPQAHGP